MHPETHVEMRPNNKIEGIKSYIWKVASKWRGSISTGDFLYTILAFVIIRRFECLFEPYREKVMRVYEKNRDQLYYSDMDEKIRESMDYMLDFYICTNHTMQSLLQKGYMESVAGLEHYIESFDIETAKQLFDYGIIEYANRLIYARTYLPFVDSLCQLDLGNDISNYEFGQLAASIIADASNTGGIRNGYFYTSSGLCKLMASLILLDTEKREGATLYDPVCGTGNLLNTVQERYEAPMLVYGQDLEPKMCGLNGLIAKATNMSRAQYRVGDVLHDDCFEDRHFDYVVADIPSNIRIHADIIEWDNARFPFGLPSNHNANWLFIQHIISKMNSKGRAAFACSPSIFYEDNFDSNAIRSWLLRNDYIQTIVTLPGGLVSGTTIAFCLCLLNKNKPKERKNRIQIINATTLFTRLSLRRNALLNESIDRIISLFSKNEENEFSHIADNTEFLQYVIDVKQPYRDIEGNIVIEKGEKKADPKKTVPITVSATEENIIGYINRIIYSSLDKESWIDYSSIKEKCIIDIRAPFKKIQEQKSLQLLQSEMGEMRRRLMGLFEESLNPEETMMVHEPSDFHLHTFLFGSVASVKRGRVSNQKKTIEGEYPVLSPDYLRGYDSKPDRYVDVANEDNLVREGDTLILLDGENVGEVFYGKPGVMPTTMAKLELKSGIFIPEYFYLLMKSLEPKLRNLPRSGNGFNRISVSDIPSIEVQAPSHITQMEIVKKVAPQLKALDRLIPLLGGENRETALNYRQALIVDAVNFNPSN